MERFYEEIESMWKEIAQLFELKLVKNSNKMR